MLDVGTHTGKYYNYDRMEAERDATYDTPREILEDLKIAKPAFTDELGTRYWMAHIGEGVKQYTINTPKDFNSSEVVKRKTFKYNIIQNHGNKFRNAMTGPNPEYAKMINYFETDYEFMSQYVYIADYLHACQSLSAAEISNDGTLYDPLTTN